jgi:dTDP-D-glucose 4,6-dehydratase
MLEIRSEFYGEYNHHEKQIPNILEAKIAEGSEEFPFCDL